MSIDELALRREIYGFADLKRYTFGQRFVIRTAGVLFWALIALIGRTLRWSAVEVEPVDESTRANRRFPPDGRVPARRHGRGPHRRRPEGSALRRQPGAVGLAALTGAAVIPVSASAERYWQVRNWDRFQIPKPFTRVVVLAGDPIRVDRAGGDAAIAHAQEELQTTLDRLR